MAWTLAPGVDTGEDGAAVRTGAVEWPGGGEADVAVKRTWRPAGPGRGDGRHRDAARAPHQRREAGSTVIYGFHAVSAALAARRRVFAAIHATPAAAQRLSDAIAGAGLSPHLVTAEDLARRLGAQAVHQGVLLEAGPIEPIDISEIVDASGIVLVLDQVTDPHNVGAILRTAAAFAVDALVTTTRHAPEMSGILAKAASGGLEVVPIVEVVNLARALEALADMGYARIGLDSDGASDLRDVPPTRPVALVLGAEDKGLRRLTRENCDVVARLAMPGAIKSLNVSNACAVALTTLSFQDRFALQGLQGGGGAP